MIHVNAHTATDTVIGSGATEALTIGDGACLLHGRLPFNTLNAVMTGIRSAQSTLWGTSDPARINVGGKCDLYNGRIAGGIWQHFYGDRMKGEADLLYCPDLDAGATDPLIQYKEHWIAYLRTPEGLHIGIDGTAMGDNHRGAEVNAELFVAGSYVELVELLNQTYGGQVWIPWNDIHQKKCQPGLNEVGLPIDDGLDLVPIDSVAEPTTAQSYKVLVLPGNYAKIDGEIVHVRIVENDSASPDFAEVDLRLKDSDGPAFLINIIQGGLPIDGDAYGQIVSGLEQRTQLLTLQRNRFWDWRMLAVSPQAPDTEDWRAGEVYFTNPML